MKESLNILTIGNSFADSAVRAIVPLVNAVGKKLHISKANFGGCELRRHWGYISAEINDPVNCRIYPGTQLSNILSGTPWDIVTIQQASPRSPFPDTYTPYVEELAKYIRTYSPKAKIYIHQTWAYEEGSPRVAALGFASRADMFAAVKSSYAKAAELISADGIIPSGEVAERATALGAEKIHRDGSHIGLGLGRYALALTWLEILIGRSAIGNSFRDFDVEVSEEEIEIAQRAAHEISELYK